MINAALSPWSLGDTLHDHVEIVQPKSWSQVILCLPILVFRDAQICVTRTLIFCQERFSTSRSRHLNFYSFRKNTVYKSMNKTTQHHSTSENHEKSLAISNKNPWGELRNPLPILIRWKSSGVFWGSSWAWDRNSHANHLCLLPESLWIRWLLLNHHFLTWRARKRRISWWNVEPPNATSYKVSW